jgi:hypothetical protein
MSATRDWWTNIRESAFFAAAESVEPEPEPVDPAAIELDQWHARRGELGVVDSANADFIGLTAADSSGLPDWRHPVQPEQAEPSEMDAYAADRVAAGIKTASDVFGADQPQPRRNASPWSI